MAMLNKNRDKNTNNISEVIKLILKLKIAKVYKTV
jgi:hypothetical protein